MLCLLTPRKRHGSKWASLDIVCSIWTNLPSGPPPQLSTFMKPRIRYDSPVDLLLFSSFGSEHSMISRGSVVYQNVDEAHGKFLWENHYKTPKEYWAMSCSRKQVTILFWETALDLLLGSDLNAWSWAGYHLTTSCAHKVGSQSWSVRSSYRSRPGLALKTQIGFMTTWFRLPACLLRPHICPSFSPHLCPRGELPVTEVFFKKTTWSCA